MSRNPTSGAAGPQADPNAPDVAYVVACYRARATLEDAVRSALAQNDVPVEIVVVDDGSNDGSRELAEELARSDPRVHALAQSNAGPGAARNRGVHASSAPFLAFLDADDLLPPDKAREDLRVLREQTGAAVVYGPTAWFDDEPGARAPLDIETDGTRLAASLCAGADRGIPIHAATIRRSAFVAAGGFREIRPLVEDLDLFTRLAARGAAFVHRGGSPVLYRRSEASRSTRDLEVLAGQLPILEWLLDAGGDGVDREAVARKLRHRALALSGLLRERGERTSARRAALRMLRRARRPGHVLEALRAWRAAGSRTDVPGALEEE